MFNMRRLFPTCAVVRGLLPVILAFGVAGVCRAQQPAGAGNAAVRTAPGAEAAPAAGAPAATGNASTTQTVIGQGGVIQGVVTRPSDKALLDLNTTMPLSLNNVQIDQVIRFMSDTTGKTVIKQRDINTQLSVNSPKPVTKRQALELIYSALQLDNIFVAEQDNMLQLIKFDSIKNIKLESIPASEDVQLMADSLRIVQKIYKFDNINADDARQHLNIFAPNTMITVEQRSNTLILTDQLTRIKAYDKIIKALDLAPTDKVIEVYKLVNANSAELVNLLSNLVSNGALTGTTATLTGAAALANTSGTQTTGETVLRMRRRGGEIVLIPDTRLNWIIALVPRNQKMELDRLIQTFDITKSSDHVVEIYKLKNADAAQLVQLVNMFIGTRTMDAAAAAGYGGGGRGGRGGMLRRVAVMGAGGSTPAIQSGDILLIPESRLNWVIAILRPDLKSKVEELIAEFDIPKTRDIQPHIMDLKGGNATQMAATINRLIANQPMDSNRDYIGVSPADNNAALIIMSNEANFKVVQDLVDTVGTIPNTRVLNVYKIASADVTQLIMTLNTIITTKGLGTVSVGAGGGPAPGGGGGGGMRGGYRRMLLDAGGGALNSDIMMMPDTRLNWLIVIMKPELKKDLDALIKQFDVENSTDVQARTIEVKTATAQFLASTITSLLQDKIMNAATPRDIIRITATDDTRIIVMSSAANFKLVQDLITTVDTTPDDRVVDIYKMKYADATELTALLNNVILKSPMTKGGAGGSMIAASGGSGNNYSRYSSSLGSYGSDYSSGGSYGGRRMGGLAASAGAVQIGAITLIPDPRLNWIIAICPRTQKAELDTMVKQFDIEKPKDMDIRMIDVQNVDASVLAQTLTDMLAQQIDTSRRDIVRVTAAEDNRRLMVWSTELRFKDVVDMVKTLDVETEKDVQMRMITVQYADPIALATTINNVVRDQSSGSSYYDYVSSSYGSGRNGRRNETVRVSATEDGTRLMVYSTASTFKTIQEIMKKLDIPESANQVTKVYKIENLEVQALSDQLTQLYQMQDQNNGSNNYGYSDYYYGGGGSRNQTKAPKPSFVPSTRNNTLMVMARQKDFTFIEAMIESLDSPIDPDQFKPRIYRIRNTDAAEVVNVLENLFSGRPGTANSRPTTINYNQNSSWRPNRADNMDAIEQVFGKLRFVVDRVTNTIVALSSNTKNYDIIDRVIEDLDKPDPESSEVMVFDLKYADALKIANQLNYLFSEGQTQRPNTANNNNNSNNSRNNSNNNGANGMDDTINTLSDEQTADFVPLWGTSGNSSRGGGGGGGQNQERPINTMIGSVRVVPDIRSNKLMVASPSVYFPTLQKLVMSLDHNEPQVYITTRMLEITRGNERRIGIHWTPDVSQIDPGELDGALLALNQLGFVDAFGGGKNGGISNTLPGMAGLGSRSWATPASNGQSIIGSNVNLALVLQLLMKNTQSRMYTEPGVTVNNNEDGNIFFGSEYPFQTGTTTYDTGARNSDVTYQKVGISLDIRPHINSRDEVVLKTAVENSNVRPELINGQLIKDMRRFTTDVSLKSGETMVIGGILTDNTDKTHRGVPVLGSLPVLKYVFGKSDDTQSIHELVFFVTPTVINNSADANQILNNTNNEIKTIEDIGNSQKPDTLLPFEKVKANPKPKPEIGDATDEDSGMDVIKGDPQPAAVPPATPMHRKVELSPEDEASVRKAIDEIRAMDRREAVSGTKKVEQNPLPPPPTPSGSAKPVVRGRVINRKPTPPKAQN